ncbi:MAG: hypothetical protein KIT25_22825 [Enhydrobacter sp.]|nr:MAG: hypothetical protein KIT25_22825 [Enhydrobacter sp.]
MSLADKLAATRTASAGRISPERQAIMHRATDDLRRSGAMDRIAKVGSTAPSFELVNHDGQRVSSAERLASGPMIVSFFRGSW